MAFIRKRTGKRTLIITNMRKKAARKNRKPRTNFVRQVKKIVQSLAEDKKAYTSSGDSLVLFNSSINSVGDIQPIVPAMGVGVESNQRIGSTITAKSLKVKGFVKLEVNQLNDGTKLPTVAVRMLVVSMKHKPSYAEVTASAAPLATLLLKGGITTSFLGNLTDLHADVNRQVYTVHKDYKFYLNQDFVNVTGPSPPTTILAQDISKTIKFFNFSVKCKNRKLMYDEDVSSDSFPVNFCPFIILGYTYLDGSAYDTIDTKVGLSYDSVLTYEDN